MSDGKPIIIIKKKGGHGGHHGGAWKVAYADFVTAMMAFFMVMWLVNSADSVTKKSIASYFRKPGLFEHGSGTPLLIGEAGILDDAFVPTKKEKKDKKDSSNFDERNPLKKKSGAEDKELDKTKQAKQKLHDHPAPAPSATPEEKVLMNISQAPVQVPPQPDKPKEQETPPPATGTNLGKQEKKFDGVAGEADPDEKRRKDLRRVADQLRKELESTPGIKDLVGLVNFTMEGDGLRIDIADTENQAMFSLGSASVLPEARELFTKVGTTLAAIPYPIDIIGHTDGKPYSARKGGYSNWELSSDRANAARRMLELAGVDNSRFGSVMGRADKELRNPLDPLDAKNRRISMKVRFPQPKVEVPMKADQVSSAAKTYNEKQPSEAAETNDPTSEAAAAAESTPESLAEEPTPSNAPVGADGAAPRGDYYKPKTKVSARESAKKRVTLDEEPEPPAGSQPTPKQARDKIFGDVPVIGPQDIFSGF